MLSFKDRRRIRDEEVARAPLQEKQNRFSSAYPLVISTIALLISGTSAYYTVFYEHRALSAVIRLTEEVGLGIRATSVISNPGNHTEVVLNVTISVNENCRPFGGESDGPFVLKAGESVVSKIVFRFDAIVPPYAIDGFAYVNTMALLPNGDIITVETPVAPVFIRRTTDHSPTYLALGPSAQRLFGAPKIVDLFNRSPPCPSPR